MDEPTNTTTYNGDVYEGIINEQGHTEVFSCEGDKLFTLEGEATQSELANAVRVYHQGRQVGEKCGEYRARYQVGEKCGEYRARYQLQHSLLTICPDAVRSIVLGVMAEKQGGDS
jgi:hypothetical protein